MHNANLIEPPIPKRETLYKDGNTSDIINSIVWADSQPEHKSSTKKFAPTLKGPGDQHTCYNIWNYVKTQVKYVLDPTGKQDIKSPAQTAKDGFADCKSRSLFMASCLANLGIPYAYRFVSYSGSFPYTHVYVIAKTKSGWYAMDPDMDKFNQQKPSTYFKDKDMSEINYIAGPGDNATPLQKLRAHKAATPGMKFHKEPTDMNQLDMEIIIRHHRHAINKHIMDGKKGVGSTHSEELKDVMDAYDDAAHISCLPDLEDHEKLAGVKLIRHDFKKGLYNSSSRLAGIGDISERNNTRSFVGKARKETLKQRIKNVGAKIKKGVKAVGKGFLKINKALLHVAKSVANAPLKLLLNVELPKASDFFIYLFVKDPLIIAKLPMAARKKRKTSEMMAKFICSVVGMKEEHFMGLIRNGIMKKHHLSPERVLQQSLHMNISGIGTKEDPAVGDIYGDILKAVFTIIKKIASIFHKSPPKEVTDAVNEPDAAPNAAKDFSGLATSDVKAIANQIAQQPVTPEEKAATDPDYVAPAGSASGSNNNNSSGSSTDDSATSEDAAVVNADEATPPADARNSKMC